MALGRRGTLHVRLDIWGAAQAQAYGLDIQDSSQ